MDFCACLLILPFEFAAEMKASAGQQEGEKRNEKGMREREGWGGW